VLDTPDIFNFLLFPIAFGKRCDIIIMTQQCFYTVELVEVSVHLKVCWQEIWQHWIHFLMIKPRINF